MSLTPLLPLEFGFARALRRHSSSDGPLVAPLAPQRAGLVLLAAHTVLPEASVASLPPIAREELAFGLTGPIRSAFAGCAEPDGNTTAQGPPAADDKYLSTLVTQLLLSLTGLGGLNGALTLVERIHLARAVRGTVSVVVATACLAWYGAYIGDDDLPCGRPIAQAQALIDTWTRDPLSRPGIEAAMTALAQRTVGDAPADLLDIAV